MGIPDWLSIVIRSIVLVLVLFLLTKWLGKKQISQLSFFEYVSGITIGSIAAEISTGLERNMGHGILSLVIWTGIPFLAGLAALKSRRARELIEGKSTIVVQDGKIQEENLNKEKYSPDELLELLRKKNAFNIADVEFAVLEADGDLNVLLKKEKQPLTPSDIQLSVPQEKEPQTVIMEAKILDEPLGLAGYSRQWLETELAKLNVALDNVYIGQINSYGELSVDIYDDKVQVPSPQERPVLLATLKKCQADLELFSLETDSSSAKEMYKRQADRMQNVITRVSHLLIQ